MKGMEGAEQEQGRGKEDEAANRQKEVMQAKQRENHEAAKDDCQAADEEKEMMEARQGER